MELVQLWLLAISNKVTCRTIDKVDATMAAVNEQRELANEVAEAISTGGYANADFDEVCHHVF